MVSLVVLGGGSVGETIRHFARQEGWDVVVVDPHRSLGDTIQQDGFEYVRANQFAPGTYFVNAMPVYDPERVSMMVSMIIGLDCHYLDISEDLDCGIAIRKYKDHVGTLIAPHCGLAPGISTIMAANLMRGWKHIEYCRINVGALPQSVDTDLQHISTWSPEGLVNEYVKPHFYIKDGELKESRPDFWDVRRLVVEGIALESCPTSGGMGTSAHFYSERNANRQFDAGTIFMKNMEYRSLRYPGHWEAVIDYIGDRGESLNGRDALKERFRAERLTSRDDIVVMHIEAQGGVTTSMTTERITKVFRGDSVASAIQKTTAWGPLWVIDCHAKKVLPSRYLAQEEIRITDGVFKSPFNPFR